METTRVTASEFQKAFGALSNRALREPVMITKQGRDHLVVLAAEEYARLKRRDRRIFAAEDITDAQIEAIRNARVSREHAHLDAELEDWKP